MAFHTITTTITISSSDYHLMLIIFHPIIPATKRKTDHYSSCNYNSHQSLTIKMVNISEYSLFHCSIIPAYLFTFSKSFLFIQGPIALIINTNNRIPLTVNLLTIRSQILLIIVIKHKKKLRRNAIGRKLKQQFSLHWLSLTHTFEINDQMVKHFEAV